MQRLKDVSREDVFAVPVPPSTESYVAISNKRLITTVERIVGDFGYQIQNESYSTAQNGKIMIGKMSLSTPGSEIGKMLAVGNSYNKARRVAIASGAQVFCCLNGMFTGDYVRMRLHTGKVEEDLETMIELAIKTMEDNYEILCQDAERMKQFMITRTLMGQIVGDMYLNHQIMTSVQLSIVKRQIQFSEHFRMVEPSELNLWNLYNNITESLKITHPLNYISAHRNLHSYVKNYMDNMGDYVYTDYDEMIEEFETVDETQS